MSSPISVCMIVRNEEKQIEKSIRSVLTLAAEVIVVDTGSTDRTAELAKQMGAFVYSIPWQDDFAVARNAALERATQRYILVLDADEQLDPGSGPALSNYVASATNAAGRVQLRNKTGDGEETHSEITRLFPNGPEYRYHGRIHEQLLKDGQPPEVVSTGVILHHDGYRADVMQERSKIERNLSLLLTEEQERPHDPYVLFQIAKTCCIAKRYEETVGYAQRAIDLMAAAGDDLPSYLPELLSQYGQALLQLREFGLLFDMLATAFELYPDYTDLYFLYGTALIERKDPKQFEEIGPVFEHCLRLGEPDPSRYETVRGVGSYRALYNLGVFHEVKGELQRAGDCYRQSASAGYRPAEEGLSRLKA